MDGHLRLKTEKELDLEEQDTLRPSQECIRIKLKEEIDYIPFEYHLIYHSPKNIYFHSKNAMHEQTKNFG